MRHSIAVLLVLLPGLAQADCRGETFISCDTGKGRHLEVCILPDEAAFTYAFGPAAKPDLTLREDFAAKTAQPWNGVGRAIWASIAFRNGDYSYEAWHSFDRLTEDAPLEAGVNVMRDDALVASLSCQQGPGTVIAPLFTVEDRMTEAGYCYDRDSFEWRRGGCD